jgi:halocarboxylic acid dehydrogenase DehI
MPWKKGNRLKLLPEGDARGRTREIYEEIKQSLGLPHVGIVHQALAVYPDFLQLHWQMFRPLLATGEFFVLGNRLRADAYTRAFNYFEVPDLATGLDQTTYNQLGQLTELLQYKNPLLLLIAAAQFQAFDAPVGRIVRPTHSPDRPVYTEAPQLIDELDAPPQIRNIYDDLRHTFGFPFVSYDYRALARWPDFFSAYWSVLKNSMASPVYQGCHHGIRETAWALARELPDPVELTVTQLLDAGMSDQDIASVIRITEMFVNSLSVLLLNIALARIGLEEGTRPRSKAAEAEKQPGKERAA